MYSKVVVGSAKFNVGSTFDLLSVNGYGEWSVGEAFSGGKLYYGRNWGKRPAGASPVATLVGDANGDGKSDVITFQGNAWHVGISGSSNGQSTFVNYPFGQWGAAAWQDGRVGDFNGDGKDDVMLRAAGNWWVGLSTGTTFNAVQFDTWSTQAVWKDFKVADFDGDGKSDLLGWTANTFWVGLSTGSHFQTSLWGTWDPNLVFKDLRIGDFNGDGKADVLLRSDWTWWVALANSAGTGFAAPVSFGQWGTTDWKDISVGDFNGDGKDDIVARAYGTWWAGISTGAAFNAQQFATWSNVPWVETVVGDFNGDGKDDIVSRTPVGAYRSMGISTGTSFSTISTLY